jgi:hypothetical protein
MSCFSFDLIRIVRGGVQLGPLDNAATSIVPVPGDYDDDVIGGNMIGSGETCPSATFFY